MASQVNSTKQSKKKLIPFFFKLFQEKKEYFQTHSVRLVITLIPKADKDTRKENYRLMSLMNTVYKSSKKY